MNKRLIAECNDVEFLRETVELLWNLLDDIDTASDMAKDNNTWYRSRVEYLQHLRWGAGIDTDGQDLFRAEAKCKKKGG